MDLVMRTKEQWTKLFVSINIPADIREAYTNKFIFNHITELNFPDFTKDDLCKLSLTTFGDFKIFLHKQKNIYIH